MFHLFASSLTTLFVAIGPVEVASMFLALTAGMDAPHRRKLAILSATTALGVLLAFALGGIQLLELIGVGLPAFRTASLSRYFATPCALKHSVSEYAVASKK